MQITYEELRKVIHDNPDSFILRCGTSIYHFMKYGNRWFSGEEYLQLIEMHPRKSTPHRFNELEFNTSLFELVKVGKLYDLKKGEPGHTIYVS